jgi:hypothetical protein
VILTAWFFDPGIGSGEPGGFLKLFWPVCLDQSLLYSGKDPRIFILGMANDLNNFSLSTPL